MRVSVRTSLVGVSIITLGLASTLPAFASSTRPSAPRSVQARAANAAATLTWLKPLSTGGSPITRYVATAKPSGKTCIAMGLGCSVKGLTNGVAYSFSVVAYNKNGAGVLSMPSNKVTPVASHVRVLVATPSTGLSNHQTVKVTGTGFTPNDQVFLIECVATSTNQAGCDLGSATMVTVSAKGILPPTAFMVLTGTIGDGKCGTTAANAGACAVNVGNANGGDTAQALIKFKA